MSKDLLFYSNHCEYSKSVLIELLKRGCRERFFLVCVDNTSVPIPREIDRVPAIITRTKNLIMDGDVIKYIQTFYNDTNSVKNEGSASLEDIQPFSLNSDIQSYSDNFTFIEENPKDTRLMNFGYIGEETSTADIPKELMSQKSEKKNKIDDVYEKYVADRDAELQKLFGNAPRPLY